MSTLEQLCPQRLQMSIVCFFILLPLIWAFYQKYVSPLAKIPGPFWASVSRLWYFQRMHAGDMHHHTRYLHKKYGPVVRIAPDEVSCADPDAMRTIYAANAGYRKTDWYSPFAVRMSPHGDSFTELDEKKHTSRRKLISKIYSMSSILESESQMNNVSRLFLRRMSEFADAGRKLDLGEWLQFYVSDIIGELFYGHPLGFIEQSKDIGGFIEAVDILQPHFAKTAVLPSWVRSLQTLIYPFSSSFRLAVNRFCSLQVASKRYVDERVEKRTVRKDMLEKLLVICDAKSPEFDITDVYTESYSALFAGSDTVAMAMRSVIYHLCRNLTVYKKLLAEIDDHHRAGQLSEYISYAQAIKMTYTIATIKEAMRVHPSTGLTYPRHVPKGGAMISGHFFPEGTRVGVSPYVLHFNKNVFGFDAEEFNPDRWLRPEAQTMDSHMFQFGKGPRNCIGQNVAIAELYTFIPQFLRAFEVELVEKDRKWTERNSWFVKQTGLICWVRKRDIIPSVW